MMELPEERLIELIKDHYDIDISHNVNDFENVDCTIYEESTADGYSVYVVTNNTRNVSICEDVYYYDHDLADAFEEQIRYGSQCFYIEASIYDDSYFDDKLVSMFADSVEDIIENEDLDITIKEINQLKEEYGIEDEEEQPETA
jgi:hypothetical protein